MPCPSAPLRTVTDSVALWRWSLFSSAADARREIYVRASAPHLIQDIFCAGSMLHYADGPEAAARFLVPHIMAEYLADGALLGIEILSATTVLEGLLRPLLEAPEPEGG